MIPLLSQPPPEPVIQYIEAVSDAQQAEEARIAQEAIERADLASTELKLKPFKTFSNVYVPRNCTWYVAGRIQVPSDLHNAKSWGKGLLRYGWRTGTPRRGAIGQKGNHVVVAERVEGDQVFISEYNFKRHRYSERWVPASDFGWYFE